MKKSFYSVILATACATLHALEITSQFPIVTSSTAKGTPEQKAPLVLQEHLRKIFGREVNVIPESSWKKDMPAIVLLPNPKLAPEEWSIVSNGKTLTISGGWPRGLYYGVCEFLEKFAGVRWFTVKEIKIPRGNVITVPDDDAFRRKPAFPLWRNVISGLEDRPWQLHCSYLKSNNVSPFGEWPTLFESRGLGAMHTFYKLTKDIPEELSRLLPEDGKGNRPQAVSSIGPGQVCFSNQEFRSYTKTEIGKWLAKEEEYLTRHGVKGVWLQWVDLSQNDNEGFCRCNGCKAMEGKYETLAGAQLEFINDIASAFPDQIFQTFAYNSTQPPPNNIQARDNVMVHFAFLSGSDLLRPLSHPVNAPIVTQYEGWRNLVRHKAVWAYHHFYTMTESFSWPQCMYWYIADNIRFYQKFGAVKMLIEAEYNLNNLIPSRAFFDLHNYLEHKMLDEPSLDDKVLIEEFFQFQYGHAVNEMKEYAAFLKEKLDAVPDRICRLPIKQRGIMDEAFFQTVNSIFDRAEARAEKDSALLERIAMERIPVDNAALEMWDNGGKSSGISRNDLSDRLEKNLLLSFSRYFPEKKRRPGGGKSYEEMERDTLLQLYALRHPLPVPEEFVGEDVIQLSMLNNGGYEKHNVQDPEAAYGKAQKLGPFTGELAKYDHTENPMMFGIYDFTENRSVISRSIKPEEIPADEKYHLYFIGRHAPNGFHKEIMWGHRSWKLTMTYAYKRLWNPADQGREYDIYVSCKLTGSAYVKESTKENAVYVDKILAVKRGIKTQER